MTHPSITVRTADADDLDRVESLLAADDLPYRDVRSNAECFYVAHSDGAFVGVGGVEVHGVDGLLRSVVVEASARGAGYGTALCDALEERAREEGVETLYLLTTTASAFFAGRGYEVVPREAAPSSIRGTTEFTELCPDSATCMRNGLG